MANARTFKLQLVAKPYVMDKERDTHRPPVTLTPGTTGFVTHLMGEGPEQQDAGKTFACDYMRFLSEGSIRRVLQETVVSLNTDFEPLLDQLYLKKWKEVKAAHESVFQEDGTGHANRNVDKKAGASIGICIGWRVSLNAKEDKFVVYNANAGDVSSFVAVVDAKDSKEPVKTMERLNTQLHLAEDILRNPALKNLSVKTLPKETVPRFHGTHDTYGGVGDYQFDTASGYLRTPAVRRMEYPVRTDQDVWMLACCDGVTDRNKDFFQTLIREIAARYALRFIDPNHPLDAAFLTHYQSIEKRLKADSVISKFTKETTQLRIKIRDRMIELFKQDPTTWIKEILEKMQPTLQVEKTEIDLTPVKVEAMTREFKKPEAYHKAWNKVNDDRKQLADEAQAPKFQHTLDYQKRVEAVDKAEAELDPSKKGQECLMKNGFNAALLATQGPEQGDPIQTLAMLLILSDNTSPAGIRMTHESQKASGALMVDGHATLGAEIAHFYVEHLEARLLKNALNAMFTESESKESKLNLKEALRVRVDYLEHHIKEKNKPSLPDRKLLEKDPAQYLLELRKKWLAWKRHHDMTDTQAIRFLNEATNLIGKPRSTSITLIAELLQEMAGIMPGVSFLMSTGEELLPKVVPRIEWLTQSEEVAQNAFGFLMQNIIFQKDRPDLIPKKDNPDQKDHLDQKDSPKIKDPAAFKIAADEFFNKFAVILKQAEIPIIKKLEMALALVNDALPKESVLFRFTSNKPTEFQLVLNIILEKTQTKVKELEAQAKAAAAAKSGAPAKQAGR